MNPYRDCEPQIQAVVAAQDALTEALGGWRVEERVQHAHGIIKRIQHWLAFPKDVLTTQELPSALRVEALCEIEYVIALLDQLDELLGGKNDA